MKLSDKNFRTTIIKLCQHVIMISLEQMKNRELQRREMLWKRTQSELGLKNKTTKIIKKEIPERFSRRDDRR